MAELQHAHVAARQPPPLLSFDRRSNDGLESSKGSVQGHLSVSGRWRLNSSGLDVLTLTVLDDIGLLPSRLWIGQEEAFCIHGQVKWLPNVCSRSQGYIGAAGM